MVLMMLNSKFMKTLLSLTFIQRKISARNNLLSKIRLHQLTKSMFKKSFEELSSNKSN